MLYEKTRDILVDTITGLYLNYSGYVYGGGYARTYEDIQGDDHFIYFSFQSTSNKIGESINYFMGKRPNPIYNQYGHGEATLCSIRVFSIGSGIYDGRELSQGWLQIIERYIKNNWNTYISGGSVDRYSFGHAELQNPYIDHQYGNEVNFNIWTTNSWTNEPEEGAISSMPISGISITSGNIGRVWVTL